MYDSITNQQLCTLWFLGTGWHQKQLLVTGWCQKIFQGTGWRREQSKKWYKQQSKGSYLHYQRKFSRKIIEEPVRPKDYTRRNPSDWPARHVGCSRNPIDFGRTPDSAPEEIVTETACSVVRILRNMREVSFTDRDGSTPRDVNTAVVTAMLTL